MRAHLVTLGTALALAATAAGAQQTTPVTHAPRTVVPTLGFSVGSLAIDPTAAAQSFVGTRAWGIQLDGGVVVHDYFQLGVDVGGQFLDDSAQFTQNTTGGQMKSSASVTYFSAVAGLRSGHLGPLALALNVGASATVGRRSIDNCADCHVDKLSIPGGGFVEPTVLLGRNGHYLRATDRVYFSGNGMRSVISLGGQFDFRPKK